MKNQSKKFFRDVKKQVDKAADEVKQHAMDTKEMIEAYQAFKKISVKIKRVSGSFINLDMPIYGIIDQNFQSVTFRAKDNLEEGQLLQTGKHTFKVVSLSDDIIKVPATINNTTYDIECKVATLLKI
jgi:hypothetical protein